MSVITQGAKTSSGGGGGGGLSGGTEITDATKILALTTNSNYVNPSDLTDKYYFKMTLNIPAGQNNGDYYIGSDGFTGSVYKYEYIKISSSQFLIRTPLQLF